MINEQAHIHMPTLWLAETVKTSRTLRSQAAKLAVASITPGEGMEQIFARIIWFERYLKLGADETQKLFKTLPETECKLFSITGDKK